MEDFINRVVELTNIERSKAGLPPLTLNPQLTAAAQGHTQNMALQDFFEHEGLDGSQHGDRIAATGYQASFTGENIFAGGSTPEQAVAGWMNSPLHRASILSPDFREIGVGYYFLENDLGNVNWNNYWTQVFATPLNDITNSGPAPDKPIFDSTPIFEPTPDPSFELGTDGNEALTGDFENDAIVSLGGDDIVSGGAGNDDLNGNQGNDSVSGDEGDDFVRGGKGDDIVIGGSGDDLHVNGNIGNDQVYGGDGDDIIYGGRDNDICFGEAGDDFLSGDLGVDVLIGGDGTDVYALREGDTDIVYYNDFEDFIGLPTGLSFDNLTFSQGFDEFILDNQIETQIINRINGQILAVLAGVDPSQLDNGDFFSV